MYLIVYLFTWFAFYYFSEWFEFSSLLNVKENTIELKRHIAMDTEEYFKDIHNYLKEQKDIDKKLLDKADSIERFLSEIQRKYESIFKER